MLHNKEILIENIMKKIGGNRVLIWGACERNNDIIGFFRENGIDVIGYIDRDCDKNNTFNSLPVYNREIIKENDYFVYVGLLKTYDDIISFFEENNYNEFKDYWYPYKEVVLDGSCTHYDDIYGNEYNAEQTYKIDIKLKNSGKLTIGKNCIFKETEIKVIDNSEVVIEDCSEFYEKNLVSSVIDSKIHIGKNFKSSCQSSICCSCNSEVIISENVTVGQGFNATSLQNSKAYIGKDCMFSYDIIIRAGSGHNLFDMENNINLNKSGKTIVIGEHVWVGLKSILFNGCDIGSGSVVGANTFVNKKFPKNCSIAGNPVRIIKENIAWRRESGVFFENYEDFAEFDFR